MLSNPINHLLGTQFMRIMKRSIYDELVGGFLPLVGGLFSDGIESLDIYFRGRPIIT